ncbi:hypothetical protein [Prevotella denticola]|uniref:hypothetical protein n=1 Tax=Prevotella denticola TaxID=28129 RepID=UPI001C5DA37F|nr:hypothetical protein [Prevotella denticola]MBW4715480.1 hypothetical protein [Prevotella denticola]MBW4753396.1 hypothetical protein [Prevotella denticola]
MEITMKIRSTFKARMLCMVALLGTIMALTSCSSEEIAQDDSGKTPKTDKNFTTFSSIAPNTRATMSPTGVFKWEPGDKIYVKDDKGEWRESENTPTSETATFDFIVPGWFSASKNYTVYYTGQNSGRDKANIWSGQRQHIPNNANHVSRDGDCGWGIATATTGTVDFIFKIDHKAAFLKFTPYCGNNKLLNGDKVKLTNITIFSNNDIAGTYTLNPAKDQITDGIRTDTIINLSTTGGEGEYDDGFPIPAVATSEANACYVVILPGTHTLRVRFGIKDLETLTTGYVTKEYPAFNYAANTIYDMPSELKVKDYSPIYYMWDAKRPYWFRHEWNKEGYVDGIDQPTNPGYGKECPQPGSGDNRYYNYEIGFVGEGTHGTFNPASPQHVPNANEMSWYVMYGDPHWDEELWTAMGHIHSGGMWIKKKANISGFRSDLAADNKTDMRTTNKSFSNHKIYNDYYKHLFLSEKPNYFYLPAFGQYQEEWFHYISESGFYWTSSACPFGGYTAYSMQFGSAGIVVEGRLRAHGNLAIPFE